MSRPYFPPPQRAQKIIDSTDVQQKVEAGTHRVEVLSKYIDLQLIEDKPVGVPVTDANGKETAKEFRVWKVPKSQRPKCGARCRDGHLCQARVTVKEDGTFNTRCRMHGGASPFAIDSAPVKARIARLEATRDQLNAYGKSERENAPEVAALVEATLSEIEETLEMLQNGPEKTKRRPSKPKPQLPGQTLNDQEMGTLLIKLGVFSNINSQSFVTPNLGQREKYDFSGLSQDELDALEEAYFGDGYEEESE